MTKMATPYLPPVETTLRVWLLDYSTEFDWVIAESAEAAKQVCMDEHGWAADDLEGATITALPGDKLLPVFMDEPFREPTPQVELTAEQWCQRYGKPCILATTLY